MKCWLIKIFIFLVLPLFGNAQNMMPQIMDSLFPCYRIQYHGLADYSSTSINRDLLREFNQGGLISQEVINSNSAIQKDFNRVGLELMSHVDFEDYKSNAFKNEKYGMVYRAGYFSYLSAEYTKDAFDFIFKGNSAFQNDTAYFSGTELKGVNVQKMGWGIINKSTKSSLVFNVYGLSAYQHFAIVRGEYYSDTSNDVVSIDALGRISRTEDYPFYKGFGFGIDWDYRMDVQWFNQEKAYFQFKVQNLGVAYIDKIKRTTFDTYVDYQGLTISEIIQYQDDEDQQALRDTLGIHQEEESSLVFLPAFLQIGKLINDYYPGKWQSYFGMRMYTTLNYKPMIYFGSQYEMLKKFRLGLQASYGGFTNFRVGFYTQYVMPKFRIGVGCEDLYGGVSSNGKGESIFLNLSYQW